MYIYQSIYLTGKPLRLKDVMVASGIERSASIIDGGFKFVHGGTELTHCRFGQK